MLFELAHHFCFCQGAFLVVFRTIQDDVTGELSGDSLFDGDLQCFQAVRGYRFSIDSVLIAHFVGVRDKGRILDLGTGCGIIMLILLYRWRGKIREITGIEFQEDLAAIARKNLQVNDLENNCRIIEGDIKDIAALITPESFDAVVCNPPFYGHGAGRQSCNQQACRARHQILANLDDFLHASALAVRNKGAVYFIYPAGQIGVFLALLGKHRLELKKMQFVYSCPEMKNDARLVLVECTKNGGGGAKILAPLYIYSRKNGPLTEEVQKFYKKNICIKC